MILTPFYSLIIYSEENTKLKKNYYFIEFLGARHFIDQILLSRGSFIFGGLYVLLFIFVYGNEKIIRTCGFCGQYKLFFMDNKDVVCKSCLKRWEILL